MNEEQQLLTVKQLAEFLQVNEQSIRKWARDEKIPFYKAGCDYRFIKEEVLATIKESNSERIN